LKLIREGMEDYEYLKLLSDAGDSALARAIADGLFPRAYQTEQPASALMAARARIASRIVELGGAGGVVGGSGGSGGVPGAGVPDGTAREAAPPAVHSGCAAGGGAAGLAALAGLAGALRLRRRR
jgi:uncharacterized protein (TIGR03382 family)